MRRSILVSTFQIGTPVRSGQGLRIGATRRPPRGIPKSRWIQDGYFDVWLPSLAPSERLIRRFSRRDWGKSSVRKEFADAYERELLSTATGRQNVEFVAAVARRVPISLGCYCTDEERCHRKRLAKIVQRAG